MPTPASVCFVWRSYRKALWNTTVGLHLFGAHLWHFHFHYSHIVRVIAREQPAIWCIITLQWCQEAGKSGIECLRITFSPSGKDSLPSVHSGTLIPFSESSCLGTFHRIVCSWHQWLKVDFCTTYLWPGLRIPFFSSFFSKMRQKRVPWRMSASVWTTASWKDVHNKWPPHSCDDPKHLTFSHWMMIHQFVYVWQIFPLDFTAT